MHGGRRDTAANANANHKKGQAKRVHIKNRQKVSKIFSTLVWHFSCRAKDVQIVL